MVIGEYPCCGGPFSIAVPDKTPAYFSEDCPHCGAKVWHKLSRVDPESWTEKAFFAEHDVDFGAKIITPKAPTP